MQNREAPSISNRSKSPEAYVRTVSDHDTVQDDLNLDGQTPSPIRFGLPL